MNKIEIRRKELRRKRIIRFYTPLILILISVCVLIYRYNFNKKYDKAANLIISKIHTLEEKNISMRDIVNNIKIVENFDIERDTFPFKNFTSSVTANGNCMGFVGIQILKFEERLNDNNLIEKPVCDYHMDKDDIELVYGKGAISEYCDELKPQEGNDVVQVNSDDSYRSIIDKCTGRKKEKKIKDDNEIHYDNGKMKNKDIENILNEMVKYQEMFNHFPNLVMSEVTYDKDINYLTDNFKNIQINPRIDTIVNTLIDRIDDNKLVEVSIVNKISGHAVLVYGYDKIDENNIKFYVADCNVPVNEDQSEKVNEDIKKYNYILFTKDVLENEWSYIYQPCISGNTLYYGYNSFIPGNTFSVMYVLRE